MKNKLLVHGSLTPEYSEQRVGPKPQVPGVSVPPSKSHRPNWFSLRSQVNVMYMGTDVGAKAHH